MTKNDTQFVTLRKLGEGGQGSVYLVKRIEHVGYESSDGQGSLCGRVENESSTQLFALKKIQCDDLEELNLALREAQSVLQLKHPYIVRCFEFFIERDQNKDKNIIYERVCILYDYCERGSLQQIINKSRQKNVLIPPKNISRWIQQICSGIKFIHECDVIHRDIKPANIFLTNSTYDVKIGDFGFAKAVGKENFTNTILGTKFYSAPEIRKQIPYNSKIDIWGIACILLDLLLPKTLDFAYEIGINSKELYTLVKERYNDAWVNVVKRIAVLEPNDRPTCSEIIEMLKSMNYELMNVSVETTIGNILSEDGTETPLLHEITPPQSEVIEQTMSTAEVQQLKKELKISVNHIQELERVIETKDEEIYFLRLNIKDMEKMRNENSPSTTMEHLKNIPSSSSTQSSILTQTTTSSTLSFSALFGGNKSPETPSHPDIISLKEIRMNTSKKESRGSMFTLNYAFWKKKNEEERAVVLKSLSAGSKVPMSMDSFLNIVKYDTVKIFKHPNIECVYGLICDVNKHYHLVTEQLTDKNLRHVLLNHNVVMSFKVKVHLAHELAKALMYIHDKGYVFGALRTNFVLLDNNFVPKFVNLHYAVPEAENKVGGGILEYYYRSPEQIKQKCHGRFTFTDSIYTFGIIMWEIFHRQKPYSHMRHIDTSKIVKGELRPFVSDLIDMEYEKERQQYLDIMKACWSHDISHRPTAKNLVYKLGLLHEQLSGTA